MSIRLSQMMELVSQAEREGVTLAAMVTRKMSAEELDLVQAELAAHITRNYAKIEDFMAGVSIPSISEVLARRDEPPSHVSLSPLDDMSDDEEIEEDGL